MSQRLHVAVIMDGNGRWARQRGRPRRAGHRAGARAVRCIVEQAPSVGIDMLTVFAFSADNWQRPSGEVSGLMRLFESYLRGETARCVAEGVRISVIGRRDRLGPGLLPAIEAVESGTADGTRLHLTLAVDYSSRHALSVGERQPDVDLLIRTGGERRLSDFLLWECAYAELIFTERMWPDFDAGDLAAAIAEFRSRDRRFGRIAEPAAPGAGARAEPGVASAAEARTAERAGLRNNDRAAPASGARERPPLRLHV
jgi:undecaprenyl diphosphate synthase